MAASRAFNSYSSVLVVLLVWTLSAYGKGPGDLRLGGTQSSQEASMGGFPNIDPPSAPKGLNDSDWQDIRTEYAARRHDFVGDGDGHRATNPSQGWTMRFDGQGFVVGPRSGGWEWGLGLAGFGVAGNQVAMTQPRHVESKGQRLSYHWNDLLTEWFINDGRGLEHGYTIHRRPSDGTGPLALTIHVRGGLSPFVESNGHDVVFRNVEGGSVLNYAGLVVFDANQKSLPARFVADGSTLLLTVDDHGAQYPITIDPVAQQAYLKASNPGAGDLFGHSIAASGDTVVVGAISEDDTVSGSGAAYVFVRGPGGIWSQQAILRASNRGTDDRFGSAVGISENTIVVSALYEDSGATGVNGNESDNSVANSGAVYVFVRDEIGSWTQQAYLKASTTDISDGLGFDVAISGDTIVATTISEDSSATGVNGDQSDDSVHDAGAAFVFVRDGGGNWSQQAYLKASNTAVSDVFGYSVGISGNTIVVGARGEDSGAIGINGNQSDNSASHSGAVYVFVRDSGGVWSQQAYIKASNTDEFDSFGARLAISGDILAVGATGESSFATGINGNQSDNSSAQAGAAYVFERDGAGTWTQRAYVKASNTNTDDEFGSSVAASGNVVVVGAIREDAAVAGVDGNQSNNGYPDAGAAYLFVRDGNGAWTQRAYLKASNTAPSDQFGGALSVSGDLLVVGARLEDGSVGGINGFQGDNSADAAGAAYAFVLDIPCTPPDCSQHGSCIAGTCECDAGWTGAGCSIPPGTCCIANGGCDAPGNCQEAVSEAECRALGGIYLGPGIPCTQGCQNGACIPAASTWGMVCLAILVLTAGTLTLRARQSVAARCPS